MAIQAAQTELRGNCRGAGRAEDGAPPTRLTRRYRPGARVFLALAVSTIGLGLGAAAARAEPPMYEIIDLGSLPGNPSCRATGINDLGQVTGRCKDSASGAEPNQAYIWEDGVMSPVDGVTGFSSHSPYAINNDGWIVGQAVEVNFFHAFVYKDGTMMDLNDLLPPGSLWELALAADVNDAGQIAGWGYYDGSTSEHAFLFDDGVVTDLGTLGGNKSRAIAINESGVVVGHARNANDEDHAFIWEAGVMTQIGPFSTGNYSIALDVNDNGMVVGSFGHQEGASWTRFPFAWQDGEVAELDPGGTFTTSARAINSHGTIVGSGSRPDGTFIISVAILWDKADPFDLYELIPPDTGWLDGLGTALGISDDGRVIGDSLLALSDGNEHAYLLRPPSDIPSTSTWGLVVLALGVLAVGSALIRRGMPNTGRRDCCCVRPRSARVIRQRIIPSAAWALVATAWHCTPVPQIWAEPATIPAQTVPISYQSGDVSAQGAGTEPVVVYSQVVEVTGVDGANGDKTGNCVR